MIYCIAGLHDPRWLKNILSNYKRQRYTKKGLIIVENGDAIGSVDQAILPEEVIVIKSEKGPAQAMNAGLEFLKTRANSNSWFCKFDSDDWYGAKYLTTINTAIKAGVDYCGRSSLYIKPSSGKKLWYVKSTQQMTIFHGPTIAGKISSAVMFPEVKDWGEDEQWCIEMTKAGRSCITLEPEHFLYQRHADYTHTWPCRDDEIRTSWQTPFQEMNFDIDIVTGKKPRLGKMLDVPEFSLDNFMPFRLLREQASIL
jgi:hypothetical protein